MSFQRRPHGRAGGKTRRVGRNHTRPGPSMQVRRAFAGRGRYHATCVRRDREGSGFDPNGVACLWRHSRRARTARPGRSITTGRDARPAAGPAGEAPFGGDSAAAGRGGAGGGSGGGGRGGGGGPGGGGGGGGAPRAPGA